MKNTSEFRAGVKAEVQELLEELIVSKDADQLQKTRDRLITMICDPHIKWMKTKPSTDPEDFEDWSAAKERWIAR